LISYVLVSHLQLYLPEFCRTPPVSRGQTRWQLLVGRLQDLAI
jgi:hypothetical protein